MKKPVNRLDHDQNIKDEARKHENLFFLYNKKLFNESIDIIDCELC